jgi:imidazolonepropionase-like amidohydrolase
MSTRKTVINNVRVFNGTGLTDPQTIVIHGALIGDLPDNPDETIDGNAGVLLPGFIDAHVHLHHTGHLQQLAQYGVTTALDMATWPAEKMNSLRNKPGLPDIQSAGLPVTAPGSIHSHMLPLPDEALLSGPDAAEDFVRARIQEGSDYIKLIADVPGPNQDVLNAVTAAAHKMGKKVVAHASACVPFQMALDAHADIVTHAPRDECLSPELVQRMVEQKTVAVPTLAMMEATSQRPPLTAVLRLMLQPALFRAIIRAKSRGKPEKYENARDSVAAMFKAGVPVLAGTDCHDEPKSFFDVRHGDSMHHEMELLAGAGLSNVDVLRAATVLPAVHFGLDDRGVVEKGKRADLVLLRDDPTVDIRATRSVWRVWCGGVEIEGVRGS